MKTTNILIAALAIVSLAQPAFAQAFSPNTTPDKIETRIGTLGF